ncbi:hypothetical protein U91I_03777 [alpha proteobacterium U9-1i]|nr:hypothetical protein U91I_03777 [alpha proteobacterium U9-1i]
MTVFIAHAPKNQDAAEGLEKFLERRGHFSELDDGQTALRPLQSSDVFILLLSQDFVFSPHRLRLEQRALDAWTENRLILVKLDHAFAPVGLRDLPAVDASFEAQREFKWNELANQIQTLLRAPRPQGAPPASPPQPTARRSGMGGALLTIAMILPGLLALAASVSIWLANRIGPTPGTFADLLAGIDAFGVRYGLPGGVTMWLFLAAILVMFGAIAASVASMFTRPRAGSGAAASDAEPEEAPAPPQDDAVFVSYARANSDKVMPVIEAAKAEGRKFWVDQQGIAAGDGWAGEIVRAIRSAKGVLVMCSKAAFESDHVKREIYLADRYHKKLVPVFVEDATPPEDFEYFFAGVQFLKLFETPEAERPAAVLRLLEAA